MSVRQLSELGDSWRNYDCIGIDEGQFYKDVSKLEIVYTVLGCIVRRAGSH